MSNIGGLNNVFDEEQVITLLDPDSHPGHESSGDQAISKFFASEQFRAVSGARISALSGQRSPVKFVLAASQVVFRKGACITISMSSQCIHLSAKRCLLIRRLRISQNKASCAKNWAGGPGSFPCANVKKRIPGLSQRH